MATALDLLAGRDPRVEQIWRSLEAQGQPPYFLSWGWIENWLAALPADDTPSLAVLHDRDEPRAAFFLAERRVRRNLILPSNALYFNATGSPRDSELAVEHNGLLAVPGARRSLSAILDLLPGDWNELHLPAVDRYAFDDLGAANPSALPSAGPLTPRYRVSLEREESVPFVDLDAVRAVEGGYDALLPSSTRAQLLRARQDFGALEVEVADDEQHALAIYDELLQLQARRRTRRGLTALLADPWSRQFHHRLIHTRLPYGEIQLVRVLSQGTTLGCLYNFIYRGHVSFYQCGLATLGDPEIKTGYSTHAAAVEFNALAGHSTYELLGGHAGYRENLATGTNRRVWLHVERGSRLALIEEGLRRWYDELVGDRDVLALRPATA
jgi:CelD/BcsL family acetyltransferase involved in cellulose biosynthesis